MLRHLSRLCFRSLTGAGLLSLGLGSTLWADDADKAALAQGVQRVFSTYCSRCHGEVVRPDVKGFHFATDLKKLVETRRVVPGSLGNSKLFKRLTSEDNPMPPELDDLDTATNRKPLPRPSKADVDLVRQWIEAGAPDLANTSVPKPQPFLAESDIVQAIEDDLGKVDPRSRGSVRYFTITHLSNAKLPPDELLSYRDGLSKLVNSLSWGRRIVVPRPIDPAETIFRIDLRDFKWDEKVWRSILAHYPYGVRLDTEAAKRIYATTRCNLPYVRADWFVFAASKPPLYHDVLQLPGTDRELEAKLQINVAENIRQDLVARAGFNGSGVSIENNRMIERHESDFTHGAYWKSYDFAVSVGNKNLFDHPLGPGQGRFDFQHDGGEIIFNLPNGLQAYMLVNASGERLDVAPTSIVRDPTQPRGEVVNGISCMRCHSQGMIEKDDQVGPAVAVNPKAFSADVVATVVALYQPKGKMDAFYQEDIKRFADAVKLTGAALSKNEPVYTLARKFESELDLNLAASEAGLKPDLFAKLLRDVPSLGRTLGTLLVRGGTIKRDVFVNAFPTILLGLDRRGLHESMNAFALFRRAEGFFDIGDYHRALADYQESLRLDANGTQALNGIAWLLATCPISDLRDGRKAAQYALHAMEIKVNDKDISIFTDTYAAALAESGEFDGPIGAIHWQTRALEKLPAGSDQRVGMLERLELYKASRPFRESPPQP